VRLAPPQVHSKQHFRPILCFRSAGAGLDINEGVGLVHFAIEHPAELEAGHLGFNLVQVGFDFGKRRRIVFVECQLQQFVGIRDATGELVKRDYKIFQLCLLASQRACAVLVGPDARVFQFSSLFRESFGRTLIVKGTPSTHRRVAGDRESTV
jgi:hypothetical protein